MESNDPRRWRDSLAMPGVLRRNMGVVAVLAVAGALAGAFAATWMARSHEALAIVKVGLVTQPALGSKPIELPQDVAERVRSTAFLRAAALGEPGGVDGRLVTRRLRDTNFVEIRYRDETPQAAKSGLDAIVERLRKTHEEMARPVKDQVLQELRQLKSVKKASLARRTEVLKGAGGQQVGEILAQMAYTENEMELRRWEMVLTAALEEPWASDTALVEPIRVYERSRLFRFLLAGGLGGVLGLVFGILAASRLDATRRGAAA